MQNTQLTTLSKPPQPLLVKQLGQQNYQAVWQAMQQFTHRRDKHTIDELWVVEFEPVYTLGQAGKREHVFNPKHIPVIAVDRGGQATYHAPGQLVMYPLFDIRRMGILVREMIYRIEQSMIDVCIDYGINAKRQSGMPGVYVDGAKIAALGLRIRDGRSFHGLALNVNMDLSPFDGINPCGYTDMAVTQLADYGVALTIEEVAHKLIDKLTQYFRLVRQ